MIVDTLENRLIKSLSGAIFGYFLECAIRDSHSIDVEKARHTSIELATKVVLTQAESRDLILREYRRLMSSESTDCE